MSKRNNRTRQTAPLGGGAVKRTRPRSTPLPSAVDGRPYKVRDSGGPLRPAHVRKATRVHAGEMTVPLGQTEREERVRLHEMAHVKWTPDGVPAIPPGVEMTTVNACEDRRIHQRLHEAGLGAPLMAPILHGDEWDSYRRAFTITDDSHDERRPMNALQVACATVAVQDTAEEREWRTLVEEHGRGWVLKTTDAITARHMGNRRPAFQRTLDLAEELTETFATIEDDEDQVQDLKEQLEHYPSGEYGPDSWAEMTITTPPLPLKLPRDMRARKRRATDQGATPRNWHRLTSDGAVFGTKRKRPGGGTVLIDQSGSMSLDTNEVLALMQRFPAVTIGTYAGAGGRGELRIIARDGRRASDADCMIHMGNNSIDGPALEWLESQAEPRVWISDGLVTGQGIGNPLNLLIEAAAICRRANIQRRDRLGDLLEEGEGHA